MAAAWPGATSKYADGTIPPRPAHDHVHGQRRPRSHATTAVIVLASLLVVLVAITIVLVLLRNSPSTTARTAPAPAVTAPDSTRLVAATQVAYRNTNTALLALHAMKGIPTPVTVSALLNPYIASLQSYAVVLSEANLPASARPAAALALAQVAEYVQFVSTVNGLRSVNLGSYLERFGKESALFKIALGTLEQHLGASST